MVDQPIWKVNVFGGGPAGEYSYIQLTVDTVTDNVPPR
jgi:hypothetical protein